MAAVDVIFPAEQRGGLIQQGGRDCRQVFRQAVNLLVQVRFHQVKDTTFAELIGLSGHGQSWVDVTSQRSVGVTYTNSTGRPIQILLDFVRPTTEWVLNVVVDGLKPYGAGGYCPIIPPGATYRVNASGITTLTWRELR